MLGILAGAVVGFVVGLLVGRRNAKKVDDLVNKAKDRL